MLLRTLVPAVLVVGSVVGVSGVYLWEMVRVPAPPIPSAADKSAADSAKSLKMYHSAAVQAFQLTPGFGKRRMIETEEEIEDIYVHWSPGEVDGDAAPIEVPELAKSHRDRAGLLAIEAKLRTNKGNLEPDAVARALNDSVPFESTHADGPTQRWRLQRVDLVALVYHEQPVVYVTSKKHRPAFDHVHTAQQQALPDQQAAADEPTADSRSLDLFEMAALEKLRGGEDMYIRSKDDALRVAGALRATKACLKCHHESKESDLFGAFSYTLKKVKG